MKKIVLILFFNILWFQLFSQNNIIKVEYDEVVSFIPQIVNHDKGILYVTNHESFYKTIFDNVHSTEKINTDNVLVVPPNESEYFSEIYMNFKKKELYENLFERYAIKEYFSVYEKIPEMKWEFLEEEKMINNYKCKKAKTHFRGRTYIVWYTEEIPISIGPWKFNGLPGLILSVEDSKEIYKWYATKIIYPYKDNTDFEAVKTRMKKYKQITFKELGAKKIEALQTQYEVLKSRLGERHQQMKMGFSTTKWKEPVNEYRKEEHYFF